MACTTLGDLNVTDCDADPNIPSGMADVCFKALIVAKMGQVAQMTANWFSCVRKVSFDPAQLKCGFLAKLVKLTNII